MGKLIRLELFNFKSYKGHHTLLFGDAYFTSIIGPNGSGKSNSMDAISFVLGIRSSQLRSTHLRELVYRGRVIRKSIANGNVPTNGNTEEDDSQTSTQTSDPKSAWVMAVYEDDAGEEQKWKRIITSQGASEYRINERVVTSQQYNESLETENILIKARNFLVFQGDVEAIAIQKPQDLTKLIEQVSGSLEFKADYDRLKVEYEEAGEQQTFHLNRRRGVNAEIRQYREQKDEADKFKGKAKERDEAIVTHVLWKLYHLTQQLEESSAEFQRHQNDLKEFSRGMERYNKSLETAKREYAEAGREIGKTEKDIKAREREIEEQESSLLPIDEQIAVLTRQLTKYSSRIDTIRKERATQDASVKQLQRDLRTVERAQAQWQEEWDQASGRGGSQLSDTDLREYDRLREEVNKRASNDQSRINVLKSERGPTAATYTNIKNGIESTEFRLRSLEADHNQIAERQANLEEAVKQIEEDHFTKRKELQSVSSERLRMHQKRTEHDEKIAEVARKLLDADDGRRASEKDLRMKELTNTLKRNYSGVRGRLHELCKPKQKKYGEAVGTVLGRHMEAIIVDTEATAKQCIEYLRDQRAGQATFIPLDTIQVKAINSNLKGKETGVSLAIDTIDFESVISRAVSYACGNAIVCDTLDIAKRMVYVKQVDARAVTLDGTVIHKGGLITGGRGKEQNTRRWDDAEVDRLIALKDRLLSELNNFPDDRVRDAEEQGLQNELAGLESRLRFAKDELEALNQNLQSKERELDHVRAQLSSDRPRRDREKDNLDSIDQDIAQHRDTVRGVEDNIFANFCQRLGFSDIRDYEARQGTLQQEAAEKRLQFVTQRSKIEGQLAYERTRLQATDDRILALQEKDAADRESIDQLNQQKIGLQDDLDNTKQDLDEARAQLDQQQEQHQAVAEKLAKARQEVQKRSRDMDGTLKKRNALTIEMGKQSTSRYSVLRRCKIENIQIPLVRGSASLERLPINDLPGQDEESMDADEEEDPISSTVRAPQVADYGIQPDYDHLDDELKEDDNEALDSRLQEDIAKLNATLEKMQPNSHAEARLVASETRLQDIDKDYSEVRDQCTRLRKEFESVQRKRNDLFNKAFSHISEQIEPIYSDLTRSAEFTAGGRAYLSADPEEPYLAGINYHTMPPAKRFRDMEHLSGGEKTMAALALLFAIHSYQPSPFFVLDEVDAALDNANVGKLVNYVRNHAGPGMQFIVISLKTGFFQGSEALVGVYRDQTANSSKVLTLDLRKYN